MSKMLTLRLFLSTLFLFSAFHLLSAQNNVDLNWAFVLNDPDTLGGVDNETDIDSDPQGNVVIIGQYSNFHDFDPTQGTDIRRSVGVELFLTKYDSNGNYLFTKTFPNLNSVTPRGVQLDSEGSIYVVGTFYGDSIDIDPSSSDYHIRSGEGFNNGFLAKYDSNGELLFGFCMTTDFDSELDPEHILIDSDDNCWVVGTFQDTVNLSPNGTPTLLNSESSSWDDVVVAKYNSDGQLLFSGSISSGLRHVEVKDLGCDAEGNLVVFGKFEEWADFELSDSINGISPEPYDQFLNYYVAKYGSTGQLVYVTNVSGKADHIDWNPHPLAVDTSGNVLVLLENGSSITMGFDSLGTEIQVDGLSSTDVVLLGLDSNGVYRFSKTYSAPSYAFRPRLLKGGDDGRIYSLWEGEVDTDSIDLNLIEDSVGSILAEIDRGICCAVYDENLELLYQYQLPATSTALGLGLTSMASGSFFINGFNLDSLTVYTASDTAYLIKEFEESTPMFLSKGSENGFDWAHSMRCFEREADDDIAQDIAVDNVGNIHIAVLSHSGGFDIDPGPAVLEHTNIGNFPTVADGLVIKYDPNGVPILKLPFAGSGLNLEIELDQDNNIYVSGRFDDTIDLNPDTSVYNVTVVDNAYGFFVAKYNASGVFQWGFPISGEGAVNVHDMVVKENGDIHILGTVRESVDFDPGPGESWLNVPGIYADIFLAKYNSNGEHLFSGSYGSSSYDLPSGMAVDSDGNIYVVGKMVETFNFGIISTQSYPVMPSNNAVTHYLAKYNSSGEIQWVKTFYEEDVPEENYMDINQVAIGPYQEIYLGGRIQGTANVGHSNSGMELTSLSPDNLDVFIARYNANVGLISAGILGNGQEDYFLKDMATDQYGGTYFTGLTSDVLGSTQTDIVVGKVDAGGNVVGHQEFGSLANENGVRLDIDPNGNPVIIGVMEYIVDFDLGPNVDYLNTTNGYDVFVASYQIDGGVVVDVSSVEDDGLEVYPNPTADVLNIQSSDGSEIISVELFNTVGSLNHSELTLQNKEANLDMSRHVSGVYLLKVYTSKGQFHRKVVVQ